MYEFYEDRIDRDHDEDEPYCRPVGYRRRHTCWFFCNAVQKPLMFILGFVVMYILRTKFGLTFFGF